MINDVAQAGALPPSRHAIETDLDWAYGQLSGGGLMDGLPELPSRFAVALLRQRAAEHAAADLLYPPPTYG